MRKRINTHSFYNRPYPNSHKLKSRKQSHHRHTKCRRTKANTKLNDPPQGNQVGVEVIHHHLLTNHLHQVQFRAKDKVDTGMTKRQTNKTGRDKGVVVKATKRSQGFKTQRIK